jgi:hypothetical protein
VIIEGRVYWIDAGVKQPDNDSLPISNVPPEPCVVPKSEKLRCVCGHDLSPPVPKCTDESWLLGNNIKLPISKLCSKAAEHLGIGVDKTWLARVTSMQARQERLVPPTVSIFINICGEWPDDHNISMIGRGFRGTLMYFCRSWIHKAEYGCRREGAEKEKK